MDIEKIYNDCLKWIQNYVGTKKVIIGISGGTDSSVAAALCCKALGKENVIGVLMPNGDQHDIDYSKKLINHLGIKNYTINIDTIVNSMTNAIDTAANISSNKNYCYKTNTPARIRMTILYGFAALEGALVVNTCNRSENYIGYSTKYGDHAGDFSPLWNLTKFEIRLIGKILNLPDELIYKIPEDGMSGKSDEENFGFTYEELDAYLLWGVIPKSNEVFGKIERMHKQSLHKMLPMPAYEKEEK